MRRKREKRQVEIASNARQREPTAGSVERNPTSGQAMHESDTKAVPFNRDLSEKAVSIGVKMLIYADLFASI